MVYLDYAATTPIDPAVNDYMHEIGTTLFANPSSLHSPGQRSKVILEKARQIIAESISADRSEIVFTSGGTEANNHAILGSAIALSGHGKHLITSKIEHPSVLEAFLYLERCGFTVSYLNVDEHGRPDLQELSAMLTEKTTLVSLMMANNETGCLLPVKEIAAILQPRNILFHSDAVQAYGKLAVSVQDLGVDLLSISAHKIYGPKGCGALFIKKGSDPANLLYGGSQEANRRPGTENLISIAGFAKAAESIDSLLERSDKILVLRSLFEKKLEQKVPGVLVNGQGNKRLCSHSNIYFPKNSGISQVINLDRNGISVSTGSACSSGASKPSHVLKAMGFSDKRINNSVRFSFGIHTTEEEILQTLNVLEKINESEGD